jgi:hypothetical protein
MPPRGYILCIATLCLFFWHMHRKSMSRAETFLTDTRGALLAPMSGVTDAGLRREAARFGAALVVSEMVASDALALREQEALLRAEGGGVDPHVVQLAGCEARWMAEGARMAEAAGADIIDINMGCPAKRVTNGWSGSALMRDLDHAASLIDATVRATGRPVTLKMRLGWDDWSLNAPELARRAEALGVRVEATRLPVVVNGDIGSLADARAALRQSGAAAVMIGRAAMGRPWLVGDISARLGAGRPPMPTPAEMAAAAARHYDFLLTGMGRDKGLRHARKHVVAYLEEAHRLGSPDALALRAGLCASDDPDAVSAGLARAFAEVPVSRAA